MRRSLHVPMVPGRMIEAILCLVAVILLWAPLWAATWQVGGMACCNGGMCPVHGHSTPNQPKPQSTKTEETPIDCEHHSGSGVANCSMSCCHQSSPSLTTAAIFVLPDPVGISQPASVMAGSSNFAPTEFSQSFEPLSPPPRIALFSL